MVFQLCVVGNKESPVVTPLTVDGFEIGMFKWNKSNYIVYKGGIWKLQKNKYWMP